MGKLEKYKLKNSENILFNDISKLIEQAKAKTAQNLNSLLTILFWNIGTKIRTNILNSNRASYGEQIIKNLSIELIPKYGSSYSRRNLFHMVKFSEIFPDKEIVYSASTQLSWTHFRALIYIKDDLKRDFYKELARVESWSVAMLKKKMDSMLFERTALSKKPNSLIKQELEKLKKEDTLSPDLVFRDPYLLNFLNLEDTFCEKDLESAILRELEKFILELGDGFCFVARQKRIQIDNKDYYIDLLFYHRVLQRLVVIELKIGEFKAAHKGQLELYLRWLDKNERKPNENSPIGLILCTKKNREEVEYLELEKSGIRVSEYLTDMPSKEVLEAKLHEIIKRAKSTLVSRAL